MGILALWYARALAEGYVMMWCHRDTFTIWVMASSLVFAAAGTFIVRHDTTSPFLALYAFIHVPMAYAAASTGFWSAAGAPLRHGVLVSLAGSMCGVVGYAIMQARVPESLLPGKFDIWGHSHQWWHILTIVGPLICQYAGRELLSFRLDSNSFCTI